MLSCLYMFVPILLLACWIWNTKRFTFVYNHEFLKIRCPPVGYIHPSLGCVCIFLGPFIVYVCEEDVEEEEEEVEEGE